MPTTPIPFYNKPRRTSRPRISTAGSRAQHSRPALRPLPRRPQRLLMHFPIAHQHLKGSRVLLERFLPPQRRRCRRRLRHRLLLTAVAVNGESFCVYVLFSLSFSLSPVAERRRKSGAVFATQQKLTNRKTHTKHVRKHSPLPVDAGE